jgi:hypothetical protein
LSFQNLPEGQFTYACDAAVWSICFIFQGVTFTGCIVGTEGEGGLWCAAAGGAVGGLCIGLMGHVCEQRTDPNGGKPELIETYAQQLHQ